MEVTPKWLNIQCEGGMCSVQESAVCHKYSVQVYFLLVARLLNRGSH